MKKASFEDFAFVIDHIPKSKEKTPLRLWSAKRMSLKSRVRENSPGLSEGELKKKISGFVPVMREKRTFENIKHFTEVLNKKIRSKTIQDNFQSSNKLLHSQILPKKGMRGAKLAKSNHYFNILPKHQSGECSLETVSKERKRIKEQSKKNKMETENTTLIIDNKTSLSNSRQLSCVENLNENIVEHKNFNVTLHNHKTKKLKRISTKPFINNAPFFSNEEKKQLQNFIIEAYVKKSENSNKNQIKYSNENHGRAQRREKGNSMFLGCDVLQERVKQEERRLIVSKKEMKRNCTSLRASWEKQN